MMGNCGFQNPSKFFFFEKNYRIVYENLMSVVGVTKRFETARDYRTSSLFLIIKVLMVNYAIYGLREVCP